MDGRAGRARRALDQQRPSHRWPNADHAMLIEQQATAAQSSQAIRDVVNAVRTGTPITGQAG